MGTKSLGGVAGGLSAVTWGPGHLWVFCRGADDQIYYQRTDHDGIFGPQHWQLLPGPKMASYGGLSSWWPTAVSWGRDRSVQNGHFPQTDPALRPQK
jgi:hypothetical protein